jgi:inorganic pyrophosphatase
MENLLIVIETPKGSVEKYDYDKKHKAFRLHKILPIGMMFPYDFGFIPDTLGEDGDPLDVIILSEFKSFPGCMMECRLLGAMLAEQEDGGKIIRNDRYIAVSVLSDIYENILSIEHIPKHKMKELEAFFINYNHIEGKKFKALKVIKAKEALNKIKKNAKKNS